MEDIKIYGLNISAIVLSYANILNSYLETIVLLASIFYTSLRIYKNLKNNG